MGKKKQTQEEADEILAAFNEIKELRKFTQRVGASASTPPLYQTFATTAFGDPVSFDMSSGLRPTKSPHDDKGVCQESYDQGYEDGVKAGLSGKDDRIK